VSDERVARPHAVERGERCQPRMSAFTINLYQPRAGVTDVAVELAHHIRDQLVNRTQRAA